MRIPDRLSWAGAVLLLSAGLASARPQQAPTPQASPLPRPKLTLSWSTASEVDNYGFLVLRGDQEEGPFKVVTEKVIPGAGTSDLPNKYTWDDFEVAPGKTYYYYLESVSLQGVKEKFSPVVSKTCCETPPAPAGPPASPPSNR